MKELAGGAGECSLQREDLCVSCAAVMGVPVPPLTSRDQPVCFAEARCFLEALREACRLM